MINKNQPSDLLLFLLCSVFFFGCTSLARSQGKPSDDKIVINETTNTNQNIQKLITEARAIMERSGIHTFYESSDSLELQKLNAIGNTLYEYSSNKNSSTLAYAYLFRGLEAVQYTYNGMNTAVKETSPKKCLNLRNQVDSAYVLFKELGMKNEAYEAFDWLIFLSAELPIHGYLSEAQLVHFIDSATCCVDSFSLGRAYFYLALEKSVHSQYYDAIKFLQRSRDLLEEDVKTLGHLVFQEYAVYDIARIYNELGFYEKSADAFMESIAFEHKMGDTLGALWTMSTLLTVHQSLGDTAKAMELLSNIEQLFVKNNKENPIIEATILIEKGNFFLVSKNYLDAHRTYSKVLKIGEKVIARGIDYDPRLRRILYLANSGLESIEEITGGPKQLNYARKALFFAKKTNIPEYILKASSRLKILYTKQGDTENAKKMTLLENDNISSVLSDNLKVQLDKLRFELDLKNIEHDLYELKAIDSANHAKIAQQKSLIAVTLTLLAIAGACVFLLRFRASQKKNESSRFEQLNGELKDIYNRISLKNKMLEEELKSKISMLTSNNELFDELNDEVANLDISSVEKQKFKRKIDNSSNKELLESLEKQLVGIHEKFVSVLSTKFPDLSSKNIKLCILVKLNLTTKEIAQLMFVEPLSVKMARSRLRKKLNIEDPNQSLVSYLNSLE